jgi:hypothetical protein
MTAMSDHLIFKVAVIVMDNKAIQCTIRKLSQTRATLEVPNTVGIPEKFSLVIDGIRRPCRAVWRSYTQIVVAFEWPKMPAAH